MEETWHVLTKACWQCCFVLWPPSPTPHSLLSKILQKRRRVCQSFENGLKRKSWYRLILWFPFAISVTYQNIMLPTFCTRFPGKISSKCDTLYFVEELNRGCGGSSCNKILGIHNNRTKLPTKSQRKPKRWKINWSISASLQKLPRPPCSNSDEICSKKWIFRHFPSTLWWWVMIMRHE